jgi:hypothetical protein
VNASSAGAIAVAIALSTVLLATPLAAQTATASVDASAPSTQTSSDAAQTGPSTSTTSIEFLPRSAFHMGAEHLSSSGPRYIWDANFGGDLDFVDYGVGRAMFYANYQVILGNEFHAFDPNQGNYILGALVSARAAGNELALVFHHESRHLSDRLKRAPVDWNMLGARVHRTATAGIVHMDARADVRRVILKSFVDYNWELDADLRNLYRIAPRVAWLSDVDVRVVGVDGSRDRGTQTGFRVEGGVRLEGKGAAIELFAAGERRIDPYPLEFGTESWFTAGFRLLSR